MTEKNSMINLRSSLFKLSAILVSSLYFTVYVENNKRSKKLLIFRNFFISSATESKFFKVDSFS